MHKALAGGLAAGVMIARQEVAEVLKPGMHASTFGGNPIACRTALATIETIESDGLLAGARPPSQRGFRNSSRHSAAKFPAFSATFAFVAP